MTNRTRQIVSGTAAASLISALAGAPMAQAAKYWSPQGASTNFNADPTTAANSNYVTTNGGSTRSTIGPADAANFDTAGLNQPTLTADIAFHIAVLHASANPFYQQFRDVVTTALRTSIRFTNRFKGRTASLPQHHAVLAAIERRDADVARAGMISLIADVMSLIADAERTS